MHIEEKKEKQNVVYEVIYVKSEHKINRIHHRYLAKKRCWLTRQIDPAKRYLYMIEKQANKNNDNEIEINLDETIENIE